MDNDKEKLDRILLALLGHQSFVDRWWMSPNKAFDNNHPIRIYESQPERIKQYLYAQLNGDYL